MSQWMSNFPGFQILRYFFVLSEFGTLDQTIFFFVTKQTLGLLSQGYEGESLDNIYWNMAMAILCIRVKYLIIIMVYFGLIQHFVKHYLKKAC